jgi:hypothetical protein
MTQDEIIEMARQAELAYNINAAFTFKGNFVQIEAFAKLVVAKEQKKWQDQTAVEIHEAVLEEREACAEMAKGRFGLIGHALSLAIKNRGES